jgi:ornithine cyclodeaminase
MSAADLRVFTAADVARLLPMADCIELMAATLHALGRGEAVQPLRTVIALPRAAGWLYTMPAFNGEPRALAVKIITIFPANHGGPLPSHQGLLILFDPDNGRPAALIDAAEVTALRTAAVSAVATRLLARTDAAELALIGAGVQARTHLDAMCRVRPIRRVRVWSRDPDRARAFARHARREDISIEAVPDAEQAVAGAAVICVVTAARTPVVRGAWLTPGAHINAVGASTPDARELDTDAVARARIFVDRREAALAEAGDLLIPIAEGALPADFAPVEIGDLLAGTGTGRTADTDITLFKSLGLAVEDAACAGFLFERGRHDPSIAGVAL